MWARSVSNLLLASTTSSRPRPGLPHSHCRGFLVLLSFKLQAIKIHFKNKQQNAKKENKNNTGLQACGFSLSSEHLKVLSKKKNHKFEVNLHSWLSSRPARDMDQDCLKRKKKKAREIQTNQPWIWLIARSSRYNSVGAHHGANSTPTDPKRAFLSHFRYAVDTKKDFSPGCPGLWLSAECNFPLLAPQPFPFYHCQKTIFFLS